MYAPDERVHWRQYSQGATPCRLPNDTYWQGDSGTNWQPHWHRHWHRGCGIAIGTGVGGLASMTLDGPQQNQECSETSEMLEQISVNTQQTPQCPVKPSDSLAHGGIETQTVISPARASCNLQATRPRGRSPDRPQRQRHTQWQRHGDVRHWVREQHDCTLIFRAHHGAIRPHHGGCRAARPCR
jgi:hypothetical protein